MIEKFDGKCAVTGISIRSILIASHIVPWAIATEEQRLDVHNGILLSPLYDALFDKYLISFDTEGHIMLKDELCLQLKEAGLDDEAKIKTDTKMEQYLAQHRLRFENLSSLIAPNATFEI